MTTNIEPEELTMILAAVLKVQRERDELRAALNASRQRVTELADARNQLAKRALWAEAEVERLRALKAGTVTVEIANGLFGSDKYVPEQRARELETEVERLTIDNRRLTEMWDTDRESLTAEVERLRVELKECQKNLAIWEAPDDRW